MVMMTALTLTLAALFVANETPPSCHPSPYCALSVLYSSSFLSFLLPFIFPRPSPLFPD
jgi:hypothetical protein